MKKIILQSLFGLLVLVNFSCVKSDNGCTAVAISSEKPAMVKFCTDNGITYTEHSSGILYQIISQGTGVMPTVNSRVFMYYRGTLLDGSQFDYQSDPTRTGWLLSNLIEGWQIAIPLLNKGGRIKMVIPSSLAYGCNAKANIPGNSPLYFDVTLTDVQ